MESSNAIRQAQQGQSQKLMIFVLAMSLFGLADLVTEMIPDVPIGPVEINVPYFAFIGFILVMLFDPFYAALGASVGEVIFSDLLMGDFSGIGEIEGVLTLFIGLYIAGLMVKNADSRAQIAVAGMVGVLVEQVLGALADCVTVWIGVSELEAIEGLPESVLVLESVEGFYEFIVAGIIVGILPAMYLVPRLHNKVEPLLGIKPREGAVRNVAFASILALAIGVFVVGTFFGVLGEAFELGAWEPDFIDQFGGWFVWIGIAAAAAVIALIFFARSRKKA
ncbi:cell division protein FtsQ [Bacillaceae bacterium Marseille-Q3522]|nr:cell division protein FtsQ [Bacillaceae bacterium Marseille-Q3522]